MNTDRKQILQSEIAELENRLVAKKSELEQLYKQPDSDSDKSDRITNFSNPDQKIALFRSLFRGREDVYAKRFESKKTGKAGYQPACTNEWIQGICRKPAVSCASCNHRAFQPVSDETIRNHLAGEIPPGNSGGYAIPFVMGIYPLLVDETCWFLALDFDKDQWELDVRAYLGTCRQEGIHAGIERSRSGNGAHLWIFFEHPITAYKARLLGSVLMTKTLDQRPEIGLDSFDRFFPNQDTLPRGGFGNLIALPLQKKARMKNHSVFLNENMEPFPDQWAYLSSIERNTEAHIDYIIHDAEIRKEVLPVSFTDNDEDYMPWKDSGGKGLPAITDLLPSVVDVIIANQIYIDHTGLPPIIRNRILRLASFSNPEFYRSQKMRLPTWNKPRILYCYEFFPKHIGIPIGCMEELMALLDLYKIRPDIHDERNRGKDLLVPFLGELRAEQKKAAEALLEYNTGILSATTAFGKTIIALYLISRRKANTLILVHRKQLMEQWVERITQFLGVPKKEIGQIGGGKAKRTGSLDIAVMQSVSREGKVEEWLGEYGQIIVDECHHISASSFEQIARKSPAFYKLGLSATVTRKDGQHPIVFMNLGKIRYSVDPGKEAATRSFTHKAIARNTSFCIVEPINAPLSIQDIFKSLWMDSIRNEMIIQDIIDAHVEGREILVLSERIEHLTMLQSLLNERVQNIFLLKGGMGRKQIKKSLEEINCLQEGSHRIILSTGKYLGEGIDFPCLDTLFLVFPISWKGTLTQYAGRLNREYYGKKEVRIYDYIDLNVPVLSKMFAKRKKSYITLGFTITEK